MTDTTMLKKQRDELGLQITAFHEQLARTLPSAASEAQIEDLAGQLHEMEHRFRELDQQITEMEKQ